MAENKVQSQPRLHLVEYNVFRAGTLTEMDWTLTSTTTLTRERIHGMPVVGTVIVPIKSVFSELVGGFSNLQRKFMGRKGNLSHHQYY